MQDHSVRLANRPRSRAKGVVARETERARHDVGMAVEIFGRRVHDHVGAQRDRPGENGRRAGRIRPRGRRPPHEPCAPRLRYRSRPKADCSASRATRAWSSPGFTAARKRLQILGIDEIDADARRPAPRWRATRAAPNTCPWARPHARPVRGSGKARSPPTCPSQDERRGRALERADDRLRLAHGLVVGTAVGIAAAIKIVGIALESRGEMDRRHDRAGALVDRPQSLGGEGARA